MTEHALPHTDIVLGTMLFGTGTPDDRAFALLDRFAELGGTWLDTADCYAFWASPDGGHGHSERVLGRWLAANPEHAARMRVSTKLRYAPVRAGDWPANAAGLSAPAIAEAFEASLERLGRDAVDVLWAHGEDRSVPLAETVDALGALVASGRVGRLGASNHATWAVERARATAASRGVAAYSLLQRRHTVVSPRPGAVVDDAHTLLTPEDADYARAEGLQVWAYTPLVNGAFTRSDKSLPEGYDHPGTTRVLTLLRAIADEVGATVNQVVLAWLRGGPAPCSPIVGVSRVEQLDEVMAAREVELSDEHRARIEEAR